MQYHHTIYHTMQGITRAVSDLSLAYVTSRLFDPSFDGLLKIELGIAKTHPKDRYVKKIGREVADKNTKLVEMRVEYFKVDDTMATTLALAYENEYYVFYGIKGKPNLHLGKVLSWK